MKVKISLYSTLSLSVSLSCSLSRSLSRSLSLSLFLPLFTSFSLYISAYLFITDITFLSQFQHFAYGAYPSDVSSPGRFNKFCNELLKLVGPS